MNARVQEKLLVLFQESFNATTIFLQLRNFLLDVSQEVRVGPIKSKLPCMASNVSVIYYRIYMDQFNQQVQAKYGAPGTLKRNRKALTVFL